MAERGQKRYYWLKLSKNFFEQKEIKKLGSFAGGGTYILIYLKMLVASVGDYGLLFFDNVYDTFYEELAVQLDESTENVKFVLNFLYKCGLIEEVYENAFLLHQCKNMIGSEGASAGRMRRYRDRKIQQIQQTSQCDALPPPSQCDAETSLSDNDVTQPSQCDTLASLSDKKTSHSDSKTSHSDVDIEKDKDKDIFLRKKQEKKKNSFAETVEYVESVEIQNRGNPHNVSSHGNMPFDLNEYIRKRQEQAGKQRF